MRTRPVIFFVICFFIGSAELLRAQGTIHGRITNATTGAPLADVNVYLSGTKMGTSTNFSGQYQLQDVPAGGYRLIISIVGYQKNTTELIIGPGDIKTIDAKLKPALYEMPEAYIGDFNKKWKKDLAWFTELFIGKTQWADSVKILNPQVLRFQKNWAGYFKATALAPLEIENQALGYHITYRLDEFNHSGSLTRWDGDPLFTELTPKDQMQAFYWRQNRKKAFYGSLRHFLLALLDDNVEADGYVVYDIRDAVYSFTPKKRMHISGQELLKDGKEDFIHHLNFFGQLEVIYTKEKEEDRYVRWVETSQTRPASVQTSYLMLNDHPITVDSDGEILEPYGATLFGYFAFIRMAHATPREYRPENYR